MKLRYNFAGIDYAKYLNEYELFEMNSKEEVDYGYNASLWNQISW